jgi:hypothetical protein
MSIHGHEVLNMMIESGEHTLSKAWLRLFRRVLALKNVFILVQQKR